MPGFEADRLMMLGLNGRPVDQEFNVYALADKLHKLPHEVREMPYSDLVHMAAYYKVHGLLANMHERHAAKSSGL